MLTGSPLAGPPGSSGSGSPQGDSRKRRSPWRHPLLYSSLVLVGVLIYVGSVFYARRQAARDLAEQMKAKKAAEDSKIVESLGGDRFEILAFYAPGIIRRGESGDLCYGVSNAKTVRIDPPVGETWPSFSRCLQVSPKKDTTYTLTAEDGKGNTKTETLTIQIR